MIEISVWVIPVLFFVAFALNLIYCSLIAISMDDIFGRTLGTFAVLVLFLFFVEVLSSVPV